MKLKETNLNDFLEYAKMRAAKTSDRKYNTSADRLKMIYGYYIKHNLSVEGIKHIVTVDGEIISYISGGELTPDLLTLESLKEELYHCLWCEACRVADLCDTWSNGADIIKSKYGARFYNEFK